MAADSTVLLANDAAAEGGEDDETGASSPLGTWPPNQVSTLSSRTVGEPVAVAVASRDFALSAIQFHDITNFKSSSFARRFLDVRFIPSEHNCC